MRVPSKKRAVKVEFEINESKGRTHTVLAKPTVIARLGEHATMEMKSPDPEKSIKLSVVTSIRR